MKDYEYEMMKDDIKEIREILKRMQKAIDKLESSSSVTNTSYDTELNAIPSTQACNINKV